MASNNCDELIQKRVFGAIADDLWIKRRFELAPILIELESMLNTNSDNVELNVNVSDWIKFVKFLATECNGIHFTDDKQWSELMNLMEISRKFNHKSVKFKELLKNKNTIEMNEKQIRQLNESAQLIISIGKSINELELLVQNCKLELIVSNNNNNNNQNNQRLNSKSEFIKEKTKSNEQLICNQINDCEKYLRNRCKSLLYNIKLELNNKLISNYNNLLQQQQQFEKWQKSIEKLETSIKLMCEFLNNFKQLQEILIHLRPLVEFPNENADQNNLSLEEKEEENNKNKQKLMQTNLNLCRKIYSQIVHYNQNELIKNLTPSFNNDSKKRTATVEVKKLSTSREGQHQRRKFEDKQQVVSVELSRKILISNGKNQTIEFSCDLYGSKLLNALKEAKFCQFKLNSLMQTLRLEFGRFYFLNDLELLTIITLNSKLLINNNNNNNNDKSDYLLCKLFNNSISKFILDSKNENIIGVENSFGEQVKLIQQTIKEGQLENERVPLKKRVNIYSVEIVRILNEFLRKLNRSLRLIFKQCLQSIQFNLKTCDSMPSSDLQWSLPLQLMIVFDQLRFTQRVELSFKQQEQEENQNKMLTLLIEMYEQRYKQLTNSSLSTIKTDDHLMQLKHSAAISMSVHFVSTLMRLKENNNNHRWQWLKVPRYYLISKQQNRGTTTTTTASYYDDWQLEVCIGSAKFQYKFEYLPIEVRTSENDGNNNNQFKRLISTSLSEKCFLIASQAISKFRLGASPFGPAGSGKTETIKALGQLVGCQVIVHNCDESNDSISLERLIWGLAHTGLWGCFDEFNRLSSGTLSTVSATLELVQTNLRLNRTTLQLSNGQLKTLDEDCAFFITLNPISLNKRFRIAGGGRRQLPSNLNALFLQIPMVYIQVDSIVGEMLLLLSINSNQEQLLINGQNARKIGRKLANWLEWMQFNCKSIEYQTCEWDLRLIMVILKRFKTILMMKNSKINVEQILIDAIKLELIPRLTTINNNEDNKQEQEQQVATLQRGLNEIFNIDDDDDDNQCSPRNLNAIEMLLEQLKTRPGVILLGPSGSGKSGVWMKAAEQENINWFVLNPKSVCNKRDLFGYFKQATKQMLSHNSTAAAAADNNNNDNSEQFQWQDGLFTKLVREALLLLQQQDENKQIWIIFDGLIDSNWIECLNSVLDDNHVLTLSSGERLNFILGQTNKCIKLIFETTNIDYASPATISRLGLVNFKQIFNFNRVTETNDDDGEFFSSINSNRKLLLVYNEENKENNFNYLKCQNYISSSLLSTRSKCEQNENKFKLIEYNCSNTTNSNCLLEILNYLKFSILESEKSCYHYLILYNLDLIQDNNNGKETKSFIELLTFILTYNFYYDKYEMNNKQIILPNLKFIISVNNFKLFKQLQNNTRLLSLAYNEYIKKLTSNEDEEKKYFKLIDNREEMFQIIDNNEQEFSIMKNVLILENFLNEISNNNNTKQRQSIENSIIKKLTFDKNNSKYQILRFNSIVNIKQSLDLLNKRLSKNNDQQEASTTDNLMFICTLDEMELKFMSYENKCNLLHLFNLLFMFDSNENVKKSNIFILYFAKQTFPIDDHYVCLTSMSHRNKQLIYKKRTLTTFDYSKLAKIFNQFNLSQNELKWIQDKIDKIFTMYYSNLQDCNKLAREQSECEEVFLKEKFVLIFVKIMSKSRENLKTQMEILSNGLKNLADFENKIKSIKLSMENEDKKLIERQNNNQLLMDKIQMQLRNSKEKQKQIEQFKLLQQEKTLEIERKSSSIENQLESVKALVELSKVEIGKCLKAELLNEIKSLRQPPKLIKDILDILFILLGQKDTSWTAIKTYLTKYSLIDELNNYDFNKLLISETAGESNHSSILNKLDLELARRGQNLLSREQAQRASNAMVPIVQWIEAARQYGRVLNRMKPLSEEREKLFVESNEIVNSMKELQSKQAEIDEKIQFDQLELNKFQKQLREAEQKSNKLKKDLLSAQKIRSNLTGQLERWQSRLRLFNLLNEIKKKLRLCLFATYLTILHQQLSQQMKHLHGETLILQDLDKILQVLEFDRQSIEEGKQSIFANILSMLDEESLIEENLTKFSHTTAEELQQLVELLIIRLNLMFTYNDDDDDDNMIQLIANSNSQETRCELESKFNLRQIICTNNQLVVLQPKFINNENNDDLYHQDLWLQEAEFALKSNRLIVLDVQHIKQVFEPIWLEIVNFCKTSKAKYSNSKIIFIGNLNLLLNNQQIAMEMSNLLGLRLIVGSGSSAVVAGIHSTKAHNCDEQTISELSMKLEELFLHQNEPQLSETLDCLSKEMQTKQRENKEIEANLLKKLSKYKRDNHHQQIATTTSFDLLNDELVLALDEMNQVSEKLSESIQEIQMKLNEINKKKSKFSRLSKEAAKIYINLFVVNEFSSKFCKFSLENYAKLINVSNENKLNIETILANAMRPLTREARQVFKQKITAQQQQENLPMELNENHWKFALKSAANLKQNLIQLIDELSTMLNSTSSSSTYRLAILLHDSKKSSPQIQVDELFKQLTSTINLIENQQQTNSVGYRKFYASTDDNDYQLSNINQSFHLDLINYLSNNDNDATIKCICIVNAHLAAQWISEHLLNLINDNSNSGIEQKRDKDLKSFEMKKRDKRFAKVLIILIAECSQLEEREEGEEKEEKNNFLFDSNLYAAAHLKYWHDELSLHICDRFQMFKNLLFKEGKQKSLSNSLLDSLILFHIVCQELTKQQQQREEDGKNSSKSLAWTRAGNKYNFDFNLLLLSLKVLSQIFEEKEEEQKSSNWQQMIRNSFSDHLETIIYGTRMECKQDELLLEQLIFKFLKNSHSSASKLELFLKYCNGENNNDQDENILFQLIS